MSRIATTDQTLIDRIGLNDTDAFEELYRQYWHSLFIYSFRKLQAHADAKKIVRTIFIDLWEMRHTIPVDFSISEHFYTEVRKQVIKSLSEKVANASDADCVAEKFSTEFTVNSLLAARKPITKQYTVVNKRSELMRQESAHMQMTGQTALPGIKWVLQSLTNKISLTNLLSYPKN